MFRKLITNNSIEDWALALLAASAFVLMIYALQRAVLHRHKRIAKTTDPHIDDFFLDILAATRFLIALAVGLYVATQFLTLPPAMERFADRAFVGLAILQSGLWANRALIFWLNHRFLHGNDVDVGARAMTHTLLSFICRMALWVVVGLLILDNIGINVTALIASLGIGGIAIALAMQNILSDLFASLSISIDKPFVIGDFIIVDDFMGSVEHVGLKTTRIRSLNGEQIIISNNDLLKSRIRNYKRMQERRATFAIGVTYDTPTEQIARIPIMIQQAVEAQSEARFDRAHFKSFGPSSLDFEAVYYILNADFNTFMDVQQSINLHLIRSFRANEISFAFPTRTLHMAGSLSLANSFGNQKTG